MKEGHQADDCQTAFPTQKATPGPAKKSAKPTQRTRKTALKRVEVVEFTPSLKDGKRTLTDSMDTPAESESDYSDDSLVSHLINPGTNPLEMVV